MDSLEGKTLSLSIAEFIAKHQVVFFYSRVNPKCSLTAKHNILCCCFVCSMHFIRRWRRPPSLSRVNSAATTNRRSFSRAGGLLCSFSNTTAATRSLAGWSPTIVGQPLPWCSTNWGRHSGQLLECTDPAVDRRIMKIPLCHTTYYKNDCANPCWMINYALSHSWTHLQTDDE